MPFIPVDSSVDDTSTATQTVPSGGRFIPVDESDNQKSLTQSQDIQSIPEASGVLGTTGGAVASGLMKGSEGILNTLQGATNVVGGAMNAVSGGNMAPPSQIFSDTAKQMELDRQKFLGNQESLHGKVLENIAQLPSILAMVGSPEGIGLLGGKGTLEAFAAQGALQAQPQTQGQGLKENIGNMAWAGTKSAAFGAVLGKAIKMGGASGAALAGAYTSGVTALEGGDPNDILAGAITGAGMVTLSNPKNLASVLSAGGEGASSIFQGAKNTFESLKTKGPLTAAADIVGAKMDDYYQQIKTMNESPDKIAEIEQKIQGLKDEKQTQMDTMQEDAIEQQKIKEQKELEAKESTEQSLTTLEQQKFNVVKRVENILEQKGNELSQQIDMLQEKLSSGIKNVIFNLKKGGQLNTLFKNMGQAFDTSLNAMGDLFSATSQKPLTRMDLIDAHTAILEKIADANGNIDGTSITAAMLNKNIRFLKETPLKNNNELQADLAKKVADLRTMGVSNPKIQEYINRQQGGGKIDLSEAVPMDTAKSLFDRAKNAEPYGSHEGDMVRESFGELMMKKLAENGQDTSIFRKVMSDMSDAISAKKVLARTFALKEGIYAKESGGQPTGYKFLEDVISGDSSTGESNSAMPKLIDVLEKGITIGGVKAEGVGDVTTDLKKLSSNLQQLQEQYKSVGDKEKTTIANIGKTFADRVAKAKSEGKLTVKRIDAEHERVMDLLAESRKQLNENISKRMQELSGDREAQQELLRRKTDIGSTINAVGVGVGAWVYKLGAVVRLAGRLTAKKATGLGKRP